MLTEKSCHKNFFRKSTALTFLQPAKNTSHTDDTVSQNKCYMHSMTFCQLYLFAWMCLHSIYMFTNAHQKNLQHPKLPHITTLEHIFPPSPNTGLNSGSV